MKNIDFYFGICMVIALAAWLAFIVIWAVHTWRRRTTRKAQIAAVYSQREETDPLILTPARVKIPLPEKYEDGDD